MKKTYNIPEITFSMFDAANVVTTASAATNVMETVKTDLENGVVTLDGKTSDQMTHVIDFTW